MSLAETITTEKISNLSLVPLEDLAKAYKGQDWIDSQGDLYNFQPELEWSEVFVSQTLNVPWANVTNQSDFTNAIIWKMLSKVYRNCSSGIGDQYYIKHRDAEDNYKLEMSTARATTIDNQVTKPESGWNWLA